LSIARFCLGLCFLLTVARPLGALTSAEAAAFLRALAADSVEVRLVCRETGNLCANFTGPLSLEAGVVPSRDGFFFFRLAKSFFAP
jgi:hypothetical protein